MGNAAVFPPVLVVATVGHRHHDLSAATGTGHSQHITGQRPAPSWTRLLCPQFEHAIGSLSRWALRLAVFSRLFFAIVSLSILVCLGGGGDDCESHRRAVRFRRSAEPHQTGSGICVRVPSQFSRNQPNR